MAFSLDPVAIGQLVSGIMDPASDASWQKTNDRWQDRYRRYEMERANRANEGLRQAELTESQRSAMAVDERERERMRLQEEQWRRLQEQAEREGILSAMQQGAKAPSNIRQQTVDAYAGIMGADKVGGGETLSQLEASLTPSMFTLDPAGTGGPIAPGREGFHEQSLVDINQELEQGYGMGEPQADAGSFYRSDADTRQDAAQQRQYLAVRSGDMAPGMNPYETDQQTVNRVLDEAGPASRYSDTAIDATISELAGDGPDLDYDPSIFTPSYRMPGGSVVSGPDYVQQHEQAVQGLATAMARLGEMAPEVEREIWRMGVEMLPGYQAAYGEVEGTERLVDFLADMASRKGLLAKAEIGAEAAGRRAGGVSARHAQNREDRWWIKGEERARQMWNDTGGSGYARVVSEADSALQMLETSSWNPAVVAGVIYKLAKTNDPRGVVSTPDYANAAGLGSVADLTEEKISQWLAGEVPDGAKVARLRDALRQHRSGALRGLTRVKAQMEEHVRGHSPNPNYAEGFNSHMDYPSRPLETATSVKAIFGPVDTSGSGEAVDQGDAALKGLE